MKTLYFDCFAGASGNMILGALIALGVDEAELKRQLSFLSISDFQIDLSIRDKSGISALHAQVIVPDEKDHRHLSTIEKIISDSGLSDGVKRRSTDIFRNLARAEAKVHGIELEKVHFHEVGALDAIVDIVGSCIGFELLEIDKFVCSKIHVGSGFVNMAHGKFPVPPPAVAELLTGIPVYSTEIEGELITPTGAAIISTVCEKFGTMPEMTVEKTAYGAGSRDYKDFPNVLRLMIGKTTPAANGEAPHTDSLTLIETNIDDLSPQILGYVMDRSIELGALDCWFTPIQMKKNRPATMVSILCEPSKTGKLSELLYTETSTIGIRLNSVKRDCLPREIVNVATKFGDFDIKIARYNGKVVNAKPEHDQIRKAAESYGVSLREIEETVLLNFRKTYSQAA